MAGKGSLCEMSLLEWASMLQARIVGVNASYFLKNGGFFVISIKASCIDSTAPPEAVFAREVKKLQELQLKPKEQASLTISDSPLLLIIYQTAFWVKDLIEYRLALRLLNCQTNGSL